MKRTAVFLTAVLVFAGGFARPRAASSQPKGTWLNVRSYGALGDGLTDNTDVVQHLVDLASSRGGGTVYFPPGVYLQGAVRLKSNVTVWIDRGAEVRGNASRLTSGEAVFRDSHGKPFGPALFMADSALNVCLRGGGVIDGQGFKDIYPPRGPKPRPLLLLFRACKNVLVENLTLRNSAAWVQDYILCSDVRIRGVTVRSFSNANNDGLDIDGSQRVLVTECNINSEDDAIVLKSLSTQPCRDVVISNCVISGLKSAIKFGTESLGGFENVTITNCAIYGTRGIDLFSVDGGTLRNVTISNIAIRDAYGVLSIRLGARMRPYGVPKSTRPRGPGIVSDILVSNVVAQGISKSNDFIAGIPGHPVERVTLRDIRVRYRGGGSVAAVQRALPEKEASYPKKGMFGTLPAYGLTIRHARDVRIFNLDVDFEQPDGRPALYAEDARDLVVSGLHAAVTDSTPACVWLKNVSGAHLSAFGFRGTPRALLHVEGQRSDKIFVSDWGLPNFARILDLGPGTPTDAVRLQRQGP